MAKTNKLKKIGIDARFYGRLGKGLGRYTQEIVDRIIRLDRESHYVIFLRKENFAEFSSDNPLVKKVLADIRWYGLAEQLLFPYYIWREKLSLMHFPHFNVPIFCPVKFVVTIHDLILIKFPTARATTLGPLAYKIKNIFYRLVISLAIRRARKILAVSNYTKNDLIAYFKTSPNKIAVTYEGEAALSGGRKIDPDAVLAKYKISRPYLLYVGNAYPHKNLEKLIKIYQDIERQNSDFSLVLVGKEDYFYHRLKISAKNSAARIIFPDYVPDNELDALYSQATAYVFPSFYEGFGLPPLEAMARGLPVASSNKTCLPEILGRAALYFDPADEQDFKNKIELIIKDEKLRAELKSRGYEQIKKYSWPECAAKTLEVYQQILD